MKNDGHAQMEGETGETSSEDHLITGVAELSEMQRAAS